MTNKRLIPGKDLKAHPLADGNPQGVFVRGQPFMAIRAEQGGMLDTPNGVRTFHAGDWVCTDIPATYAWVLDAQTFAVAGYTKVGELAGTDIVFPIAEAGHQVEHSDYTGRAEPAGPQVVVQPANAAEALAQNPEAAQGGSVSVPATEAVAQVDAIAEAAATMAAADPLATPAPSPTDVTPGPVPEPPPTKAGLPTGAPVRSPRAKAKA